MDFVPTTQTDASQLIQWIASDPYHQDCLNPLWWLTGAEGSLLSFCATDEKGPLGFIRLEADGENIRIHAQFAPESVVSKRRLVVGIRQLMAALTNFYKAQFKGLVFNSVSPTLIAFLENYQGFKSVGNNDFQLEFKR